MARPTKWRKIEHMPAVSCFVPSENEVSDVPKNRLKLEELEAIRLKDLEGFDQSECAEKMEVSRPTFQRILLSAREKIADSLVNGKMIHIEGGNFAHSTCPFRCLDCGKEWNDKHENSDTDHQADYVCPECGSHKIACGQSCRGKKWCGSCWRNYSKEIF